jgi:uncharacterized protein with NRDE domain
MCTVVLALDVHPDAPLIVAANRDEWLARPTAPFGILQQSDHGAIYGGRDRTAGGSWAAFRADGAMALLTNIRPGGTRDNTKKSRGEIVVELLKEQTAEKMRDKMSGFDPKAYNPYNVLFGKGGTWFFASAEGTAGITPVAKGVHVLGNLSLDADSDEKTKRIVGLEEKLKRATLPTARDVLLDLLANEFFVDAGPYGTRWSMYYAGKHDRIDSLEINEAPPGPFENKRLR